MLKEFPRAASATHALLERAEALLLLGRTKEALADFRRVAEATDAKGAFGFDLPPDQTAGKQYLIVWFTNLSQVDGFYRAVLGEVSVLG